MSYWYLATFIISAALAFIFTKLVIIYATRRAILDNPAVAPDRKIHQQPTPLLGGLAIIAATWLTWLILVKCGQLIGPEFPAKYLWGLTIAGLLIAIIGYLDDRFQLPARRQIWWVVAAALVVIAAGIGVGYITNPLGGIIYLNQIQITLFRWDGLPYHLTLWADLFTLVWIVGATYTTKILDGLDGLVSGLGVVGSIIVFLLTLQPEVQQPAVALLALSLGGAALGFLFWNWHPAKIFLGEGGSLYIGFILGVLAVISGGKIATALLILGLPILDLLWVIINRWRHHQSPFTTADRSHLHFRLLAAGLSIRQTVMLLLVLVTIFGFSTLYISGSGKLMALVGILVVMVLLAWWAVRRSSEKISKNL